MPLTILPFSLSLGSWDYRIYCQLVTDVPLDVPDPLNIADVLQGVISFPQLLSSGSSSI